MKKSRDTVPIMSCKNSSALLSFVPGEKNTYTLRTKETIGLFLIMRIATFPFSIYLHLSFCLSYLLPAVSLPLLLPRLPPSPRDPVYWCRVAIFYAALLKPKRRNMLTRKGSIASDLIILFQIMFREFYIFFWVE